MDTTAALVRTWNDLEIPAPGEYEIDSAHTTIEYVARHMMITKVRGRFTEFDGTIVIAEDPKESKAEVNIATASLTSGINERDEHLRSADFLDVKRYPTMQWRSTKVANLAGALWRAEGALTLRDQTRPIVLDLEFDGAVTSPLGEHRIGFSAAGELDREKWGLKWNQTLEAGGLLISRMVRVEPQRHINRAFRTRRAAHRTGPSVGGRGAAPSGAWCLPNCSSPGRRIDEAVERRSPGRSRLRLWWRVRRRPLRTRRL